MSNVIPGQVFKVDCTEWIAFIQSFYHKYTPMVFKDQNQLRFSVLLMDISTFEQEGQQTILSIMLTKTNLPCCVFHEDALSFQLHKQLSSCSNHIQNLSVY